MTVAPRRRADSRLDPGGRVPGVEAGARLAFRIGGRGHGQAGRLRDSAGRYTGDESLASKLRALRSRTSAFPFLSPGGRASAAGAAAGADGQDGYADEFGRCEFVSILERLSDAVVELAASLGLRPVKRKKRVTLRGIEHGVAYQVKFSPRTPVFRLARKLARLKTGPAHRLRAVVAVRPVASYPVRCIQVGAPTGCSSRADFRAHPQQLRAARAPHPLHRGVHRPRVQRAHHPRAVQRGNLPITLWPGMKIGQLCVFGLSTPAEQPYGSSRATAPATRASAARRRRGRTSTSTGPTRGGPERASGAGGAGSLARRWTAPQHSAPFRAVLAACRAAPQPGRPARGRAPRGRVHGRPSTGPPSGE